MQNKNQIDYFINYINKILLPAKKEFDLLLAKDNIQLYKAYSFTTILTHVIDYMVHIDRDLNKRSRNCLIEEFDMTYSVQGAKHLNQKFKLLDGINNAFKHIELDVNRYSKLIDKYGQFTFNSLQELDNRIYFVQQGYKFDYCRIVLRPVFTIFDCDIKTYDDVAKFLKGKKYGVLHCQNFEYYDSEYNEPWNAIERMIAYCNPKCLDCGEYQDKCECNKFLYGNKKPESNLDTDKNFDFDKTISQISSNK